MLTNSQKKLYFIITSSLLLFVLPIFALSFYFISNRDKSVNGIITNTKAYVAVNSPTEDIINGTYKILFTKPDSEFKSRILSDSADFGKIKTLVFEIYKADIVMHVSVVEEDIAELRNLERNSDQKINVLDSVLEYQLIDSKITKLDSNNLIRADKSKQDQTQVILSNSKTTKKEEGISYLKTLDLFPEYTLKYRNSRLRTTITYYVNTERNYKILDTIVPSFKLIEKI
jgi:hypothetical protein